MERCYHHIKSRGSGGPDEAWNLIPVCLEHHNEVHNIGLYEFAEKYPSVGDWLVIHDWYIPTMGVHIVERKWRH